MSFDSYDSGLVWDLVDRELARQAGQAERQAQARRDLAAMPSMGELAATCIRGILDDRHAKMATDPEYRDAVLASAGVTDVDTASVPELARRLDGELNPPARCVFGFGKALDLRTAIDVVREGGRP